MWYIISVIWFIIGCIVWYKKAREEWGDAILLMPLWFIFLGEILMWPLLYFKKHTNEIDESFDSGFGWDSPEEQDREDFY